MCVVETVTYITPTGFRYRQPYHQLCNRSVDGKPCDRTEFYELGQVYRDSSRHDITSEARHPGSWSDDSSCSCGKHDKDDKGRRAREDKKGDSKHDKSSRLERTGSILTRPAIKMLSSRRARKEKKKRTGKEQERKDKSPIIEQPNKPSTSSSTKHEARPVLEDDKASQPKHRSPPYRSSSPPPSLESLSSAQAQVGEESIRKDRFKGKKKANFESVQVHQDLQPQTPPYTPHSSWGTAGESSRRPLTIGTRPVANPINITRPEGRAPTPHPRSVRPASPMPPPQEASYSSASSSSSSLIDPTPGPEVSRYLNRERLRSAAAERQQAVEEAARREAIHAALAANMASSPSAHTSTGSPSTASVRESDLERQLAAAHARLHAYESRERQQQRREEYERANEERAAAREQREQRRVDIEHTRESMARERERASIQRRLDELQLQINDARARRHHREEHFVERVDRDTARDRERDRLRRRVEDRPRVDTHRLDDGGCVYTEVRRARDPSDRGHAARGIREARIRVEARDEALQRLEGLDLNQDQAPETGRRERRRRRRHGERHRHGGGSA